MALLEGGLTVTSTGTPALNGKYAATGHYIADWWQAEVNAVAMSGTAFADGTTTLNWPDMTGATHAFDVAQFKELVAAVSLFQAQCAQYGRGITTTPPADTATIA
jgi:hypothetical protein